MITFDDVSGWLNKFDRSHIDSQSTNRMLERMLAPDVPEEELANLVKQAQDGAEQEPDPYAHPETLVRIGQAYYRRGQYEPAIERLKQAAARYISLRDRHREGVALWLMGLAQRGTTFQNRLAQSSLEASRERFVSLAQALQSSGLPEERRWYLQRITEMNVAAALTVETGFRWFGRFEPPPDSALSRLMDQIDEALQTHNYPAARSVISLLLEVARETGDYLDFPKALVFAGRAEYDMGNLEKAAEHLRGGVSLLPPRSHTQAAARWMLANVLWQTPNSQKAAMLASRQAVETFAELGETADHDNQQDLHRWYRLRAAEMQSAYETAVQEWVQS